MTDTASDMLMASASLEIERLKARLREVGAERDDAVFRARLFEKAYEDLVVAVRKLSGEPTPAELAEADAWDAKAEAEYQATHGTDYWYDHANGRYQRY